MHSREFMQRYKSGERNFGGVDLEGVDLRGEDLSAHESHEGCFLTTERCSARIGRMARENATWGAKRIRGELMHLGIEQRIPCQPRPAVPPPTNGILASRSVLNELHHTHS